MCQIAYKLINLVFFGSYYINMTEFVLGYINRKRG